MNEHINKEHNVTDHKIITRGSRTFSFFIGLTILLVGVIAALYFFIGKPALSPVEQLAKALQQVTNQQVTIEGHTVTLARNSIRELAVVERHVQSMVKYETQWMGSDKLIIVQGDFLVKAGFDLSEFEGFELRGEQVIGTWPKAKILSLEQLDYRIFYSQNGVVNKLQDQDYETVTNLLQKQARQDAEDRSDILEDAEGLIKRRLHDLTWQSDQLIP